MLNETDNKNDPQEVLRVRLTMAQAFAQMMLRAFDALLHYDVNYRDLPEYKDTQLLDDAARLPLQRGQESYIEWMRRIENGIKAAIQRKLFRKV